MMAQTGILRAYAGVRPLVASDNDPERTQCQPALCQFDHAERDGLDLASSAHHRR